jgi:hypothetical protein
LIQIFRYFLLSTSILACTPEKAKLEKITLDFEYLGGDTCYFLTTDTGSLIVGRTVEFLENSISDTVIFGHGVIPGRYKGRVGYTKHRDSDTSSLYAESFYDVDRLPGTDRFWIKPYRDRKGTGNFKVRVRLDSILRK